MPSKAYLEFSKNLTDVKRIVGLHRTLSRPTGTARRGKRALGHLTRGGTVLLCAAWERYVESVVEEGAAYLARRMTLATLPSAPRKLVTDYVNGGKSSITHATLAANLEAAMTQAVRAKTSNLNTPKHDRIQPLFAKVLALADIANAWSRPSKDIDDFVCLRGEVAHRGGQSGYVRFGSLSSAVVTVSEFVVETDNYLSDHLHGLAGVGRRPWNRQVN